MRKSIIKPMVATTFSALLIFELAGCGTIIYPERRGQTGGKIDPAVVIMDGIGLLFWVIPGLVAFAIDFATGAIYTSSGRYSVAPEALKPAIDENGRIDTVQLQEIIKQQTGQNIPFNHPNIQQQDSSTELLSQLNIVPQA
ncbi:polyribonucleotide nucleotidyltransferase [Denitrificimonas caeni]|uniref:Polyribonucleotide nucleotidyltransferase n=1 Tax=Denitrificimonas caeni TaxID=521720 RepID=A0AAF0AHT1_9GAMM|nr:polyribonucleotide nucleotidyltransferase [Denitrificimonas caeni]WBE24264.1 polyribonucleotide nucleotidyltransferase [Denitrificimonas caeni]